MNPLKVAIFDEVRKTIPEFSNSTYDELNNSIFAHNNGLRLTFRGFLVLKNIFTAYSFEMDVTLTAKHYIGMDSLLFPYYINSKRLILFSEADALIIKLCGNIKNFLENQFSISRDADHPG